MENYHGGILHWVIVGLDIYGVALAEGEAWATLPGENPGEQIRRFGVPFDPVEWCTFAHKPPPTEAERRAWSRAATEMERAGLIERVRRYGKRLSHVRPTPKGLALGIQQNPSADRGAIRRAIESTAWGAAVYVEAIGNE